jgi:hypothetical protein
LKRQKRNVCCDTEQSHVGTWLWLQAVAGGSQVSAQPLAGITVGQMAGIIELNNVQKLKPASVLDTWVFADCIAAKAIDLR